MHSIGKTRISWRVTQCNHVTKYIYVTFTHTHTNMKKLPCPGSRQYRISFVLLVIVSILCLDTGAVDIKIGHLTHVWVDFDYIDPLGLFGPAINVALDDFRAQGMLVHHNIR